MRVVNSARQLGEKFRCAASRHRLAAHNLIEWPAFDQFHAEIAGTIAFADFINGNDTGMIETGRCFGFKMETL